jgi:acetate---CoA ligase (ADP-forming)
VAAPIAPLLAATDDVPIRAVLRDGSLVQLRLAFPGDHGALTRFFHRLSVESLRRRFFGSAEPSTALLDTFCTSAHPAQAATMLALRLIDGVECPIAVASYFRVDETTAEVAFAVDDQFHGRGVGTLLLYRLADLARAQGFTRFEALTLPDNAPMLDMLRDSGFEEQVKSERGCVTVQLSLTHRRDGRAAELRPPVSTLPGPPGR